MMGTIYYYYCLLCRYSFADKKKHVKKAQIIKLFLNCAKYEWT